MGGKALRTLLLLRRCCLASGPATLTPRPDTSATLPVSDSLRRWRGIKVIGEETLSVTLWTHVTVAWGAEAGSGLPPAVTTWEMQVRRRRRRRDGDMGVKSRERGVT